MDGFSPAALSALATGDMANFLVAATPGGIERQEAAGQASMVRASDRLPKEISGATREQLESAWGIKFGDDVDEVFVAVTLPAGWSLRATDHSMHNDLLDANGAKRAGIFYKAAFYDRRASMNLRSRYTVFNDYGDPITTVKVMDHKTGATLFDAGTCAYRDHDAMCPLEKTAREWLGAQFPDHSNALAYWD